MTRHTDTVTRSAAWAAAVAVACLVVAAGVEAGGSAKKKGQQIEAGADAVVINPMLRRGPDPPVDPPVDLGGMPVTEWAGQCVNVVYSADNGMAKAGVRYDYLVERATSKKLQVIYVVLGRHGAADRFVRTDADTGLVGTITPIPEQFAWKCDKMQRWAAANPEAPEARRGGGSAVAWNPDEGTLGGAPPQTWVGECVNIGFAEGRAEGWKINGKRYEYMVEDVDTTTHPTNPHLSLAYVNRKSGTIGHLELEATELLYITSFPSSYAQKCDGLKEAVAEADRAAQAQADAAAAEKAAKAAKAAEAHSGCTRLRRSLSSLLDGTCTQISRENDYTCGDVPSVVALFKETTWSKCDFSDFRKQLEEYQDHMNYEDIAPKVARARKAFPGRGVSNYVVNLFGEMNDMMGGRYDASSQPQLDRYWKGRTKAIKTGYAIKDIVAAILMLAYDVENSPNPAGTCYRIGASDGERDYTLGQLRKPGDTMRWPSFMSSAEKFIDWTPKIKYHIDDQAGCIHDITPLKERYARNTYTEYISLPGMVMELVSASRSQGVPNLYVRTLSC